MRWLWALALLFSCPSAPVPVVPVLCSPAPVLMRWVASWYGPGFDGRPMASTLTFWRHLPVVAHKTLPLGTLLRIWRGGRSVLCIVLDRGPYIRGRDVDLSEGIAARLGMLRCGVGEVTVEVAGFVPRAGWSDAIEDLTFNRSPLPLAI